MKRYSLTQITTYRQGVSTPRWGAAPIIQAPRPLTKKRGRGRLGTDPLKLQKSRPLTRETSPYWKILLLQRSSTAMSPLLKCLSTEASSNWDVLVQQMFQSLARGSSLHYSHVIWFLNFYTDDDTLRDLYITQTTTGVIDYMFKMLLLNFEETTSCMEKLFNVIKPVQYSPIIKFLPRQLIQSFFAPLSFILSSWQGGVIRWCYQCYYHREEEWYSLKLDTCEFA